MQKQIKQLIINPITKLQQNNKIPQNRSFEITVEPTKNIEHGDFSSNIALTLAKILQTNPMDLAKTIVSEMHITSKNSLIKKIDIAKPGFINFYLDDRAYHEVIDTIIKLKEKFGCTDFGKNKMVIVEFVSSNPTGPLHVGHGRGAAFGSTVANLLKAIGYNVHCEYYVNDAGRQIHILTLSIWLRYLEIEHKLPNFPENGYKGSYIIDIAKQLKAEYDKNFYHNIDSLYHNLPNDSEDKELYIDTMIHKARELLGENDYHLIMQTGVNTILDDIRYDLEEFGVTFNEWFRESHLIKNGDVQKGIKKLQNNNSTYVENDALWFKATDYGDEKDRVLTKANGQTTYFASDVGYHLNKYERNFDKIIDIFGSDHHGYIPRINAFLDALKLDTNKLKILLVQFAILYRGKQKAQMSTRSGEFVTLRQLRKEVGNDAARFFYIMRKNDQHLDFDMELAKSQSTDNPVYYIQYAHARICSVMRQLEDKQLTYDPKNGLSMLQKLDTEQEKNILRRIARYADILQTAATNHEPHLLAHYLRELANDFHSYYNAHQFLVENQEIRDARLCLISAIKQIIANGLNLLGVSTPEMM